jgi:hypothetical protein
LNWYLARRIAGGDVIGLDGYGHDRIRPDATAVPDTDRADDSRANSHKHIVANLRPVIILPTKRYTVLQNEVVSGDNGLM